MPLRLFSSRERSGAYVARVLFLGANIGFFFFSTQLMQGVLGYGPALAGVAFLPAMIVNFVAALRAPRLIVRFGARMVLIGSLVLGMIGLAWLALDAGTSGYWTGLALPMILVGISQGGALGPLTSSGIAGVAAGDAGAAAGLVNAAHQIGGAFGLSLQIAFSVIGAGALTGRSLLAWRVGNAMGGAAAMELLAILVAFFAIPRFMPGIAPPRRNASPGTAAR
jgi:MFS family permease